LPWATQVTKLTFWAQKCVNSLPWRAQSQPAAVLLFTPTPLKAGATDAEIAEALGVAINLNAGAAVIYSARTLDAVGQARG
jgi:alkylhydroperoxidase/carboxymuconolactone decarboxylase family protein YurZ